MSLSRNLFSNRWRWSYAAPVVLALVTLFYYVSCRGEQVGGGSGRNRASEGRSNDGKPATAEIPDLSNAKEAATVKTGKNATVAVLTGNQDSPVFIRLQNDDASAYSDEKAG